MKGIPVLLPKDLAKIFGFPVFDAFQELHRVVQSVVVENEVFRPYSQGMDLPTIETVRLDALENAFEETPEDFRQRINSTLDWLTHKDAG